MLEKFRKSGTWFGIGFVIGMLLGVVITILAVGSYFMFNLLMYH